MNSAISRNSTVIAIPEQVSCDLGEESVILNLKDSIYYGVNPVGASVWRLLKNQSRTVQELRNAVQDEYDVESDRCERDLLDLLERMHREGLIKVVDRRAEPPTRS
jgi:hypothetical protein